ncbi:MAG TPA: hypothetical protein VI389_02245 [Geobacteraceae bacterium]
MAVKLGELLVKAGLITPTQLDDCLKCQVIFGGRLGTNLIEMGYLEEDDLARVLSQKLGVPFASPDRLMSIPQDVIDLIPLELVLKYKVVPLALEKKRLTLAMMDPANISATDEISFITGFIIQPVVTPELRLILALEKYYGIQRETRYINIAGEKRTRDKEAAEAPKPAPAKPQPPKPAATAKPAAMPAQEPDLIELPLDEFEGFDLDEDYLINPGQTTGEGKPAGLAAPAPAAPREEPAPDPLEVLSAKLAEARDRDVIADAIIDYAGREFERAALFVIKGTTAVGWRASVRGELVPNFGLLQIPLDAPSVLKVVVEGKSFYLGPIPDTSSNTIIMNGLGGGKREAVLLLPLLLMGKVVAVIFVDGGAQDMAAKLNDLKKVVVKGALAFEILILKNKIYSL